jgi:hypothetical protein
MQRLVSARVDDSYAALEWTTAMQRLFSLLPTALQAARPSGDSGGAVQGAGHLPAVGVGDKTLSYEHCGDAEPKRRATLEPLLRTLDAEGEGAYRVDVGNGSARGVTGGVYKAPPR